MKAKCPKCGELVEALSVLDNVALRAALEKDEDVLLMHRSDADGDHVWSVSEQKKKRLREQLGMREQ